MAKQNSISSDEIYTRLHAPQFFQELVESRTATLEAAGDPEALTGWKQEREQKDALWQDLLNSSPNMKQMVVNEEELQVAVKGVVQEVMQESLENVDPRNLEAGVYDILREEQAPPIDMQMEMNREIDAWKAEKLIEMSPEHNACDGEAKAVVEAEREKLIAAEREQMQAEREKLVAAERDAVKAEREKLLTEQKEIGNELDAEVNSPKQEVSQTEKQNIAPPKIKIEPPTQG